MDIDAVDPISLDVAHQVDKISFRFYTEKEAIRTSVRRLTSPHAFDELGRPISRGLYDPALGPTSYSDGPCVTCGLTYNQCPGHFGRIEMPFPVPNPLLNKVILKILRASCWRCRRLRFAESNLNFLLARLYFEDAALPTSAFAVEAYRTLRIRVDLVPDTETRPDSLDAGAHRNHLVKNWSEFLRTMPAPVSRYLKGVDYHDTDIIETRMLLAARDAWKEACADRRLSKHRTRGWKEAENLILYSGSTKCPKCRSHSSKLRRGDRGRIFRKGSGGEVLLTPLDIEAQVKALWKEHYEIFEMLYGLKGRENNTGEESPGHMRLFVRVVLVPPSRFRPTAIVGNMTYAAEHPQNMFFQRLLTEIGVIMVANEYGLEGEKTRDGSDEDVPPFKRPTKERFAQAMSSLQEALRDLYDGSGMTARAGTVPLTGIRQQLEAKTGLFRQHMMGKRVNYSCRSVIGPDAFLDTTEVGIPESFAKLLTIPEPVIPGNLEQMRRAVLNGPDVYPGAVAVEDWGTTGEHRIVKFRSSQHKKHLTQQAGLLMQNSLTNGTDKSSSQLPTQVRAEEVTDDASHQQKGYVPKRVHRHLRNGDIVVFNRQPTLHRVSIMAHRVRVLPGDRTIRFHYANCGSYNADFDGDEMNVHVPQDPIARAEAEELMLSNRHYIVPTSGAPVRGLIQDHIAASTLLSRRDSFLDRESFTQLLYAATEKIMLRPNMMGKKYHIPVPAVLKPTQLWTGKQLFSAVLHVIRNGRTGLNLTGTSKTSANIIGEEESHVIFRNGELLQGCIDKSSIGASMYGIVHAVQEVYGCDASDDFLTSLGRLCLFFLRSHGHSTGIEDLLLKKDGDKARVEILKSAVHSIGIDVTNAVYAQINQGEKGRSRTAKTNQEAREMIEEMIKKDGVEAEDRMDNAMKSALDTASSEVMKACVPASLKKTFPRNGFSLMTSTGAKGAAVNAAQISCLLGSTVLEGKRVPRMGGSGATLPCFEPYDSSPIAGGFITGRFLTGISPHEFFFHAMSGREGLLDTSLKTANSGYLQRCLVKHLEGTRLHYDGSVRDSDNTVLQFIYGDDGIDPSKSRWLLEKTDWQVSNRRCLHDVSSRSRARAGQQASTLSHTLASENGSTLLELESPGALSKSGAISERYDEEISRAVPREEIKAEVREFLERRYREAAAQPGEAVGILAAQGVGEPSTQMTLNTFHHAGSSSAHVTLGIPRLRELLMTASKYPKTPSMTLPITGDRKEESAGALRRRLQNVKLSDLLLEIRVDEMAISFLPGISDWAARRVKLSIRFPPEKVYREPLGFSFQHLKLIVRNEFLPDLHNRLKRDIGRLHSDKAKAKSSLSALSLYLRVAQKPEVPMTGLSGATTGDDLLPEDGDAGDVHDEESPAVKGEEELVNEAEREEEAQSESSSDDESDGNSTGNEKQDKVDVPSRTDQPSDVFMDPTLNQNGERVVRMGTAGENEFSVKPSEMDEAVETNATLLFEDGHGPPIAYGSLGYVEGSLHDVDKETLEFEWSLPVALVGKLSMAEVMKEAAGIVRLSHVHNIERCFMKLEGEKYSVITEGSNLIDVFRKGEGLVDFDHLETNDMFGILRTYGVEAMRAALIKEFKMVFKAYGIPVNIRHLALIADYMTLHGSYRGFNRRCMDGTPSALQRMTFETSVNFLTDAALNGMDDSVENPSAALALGQVYQGGTGGFQLLHQIPQSTLS